MRVSATIKGTFYLYFAQILNLFLGWAVAKINITYLSVSQYGQLSFFITAINVIYVFFTFGVFESASRQTAVSQSRADYRRLLGATVIFTIASYVLFTAVFWASRRLFAAYFQVDISRLILMLYPLAGAYLVNNMVQLVLRGAGKIKKLSIYLFLPRLFYMLMLLALVYLNRFTLTGTAFLNLFSILTLGIVFTALEQPDFSRQRQYLRKLWREIKRFGIHVYWSELIKVFLYHTDKLLISYFLDASQLAYYALAYTVTFPLSFFSTALSTTSYRKFSAARRISRQALFTNLVWVSGTVLVMILIRKFLIIHLFSRDYAPSLSVVPILALAFGFAGLTRPFSFFLTAKGQGRAIRNISVTILALHVSLNVLLIPARGIIGAAWASLVTYFVDLLLSYFYYRRYTSGAGSREG